MTENVFDFIKKELFDARDAEYLKFQGSLIPGEGGNKMIGVRTPKLKELAIKIIARDGAGEFLKSLPHEYFEENQLHAFIISEMKDPVACFDAAEAFLPYVDNWATCDQMSPKAFRKQKAELAKRIDNWMASDHVYTKRFGIKMAMSEFLDGGFDPVFLEKVASVNICDYYVMTMVSWYFATALAKQYDSAIKYIEQRRLPPEAHKTAIRKACESRRITDGQKAYLKTLK